MTRQTIRQFVLESVMLFGRDCLVVLSIPAPNLIDDVINRLGALDLHVLRYDRLDPLQRRLIGSLRRFEPCQIDIANLGCVIGPNSVVLWVRDQRQLEIGRDRRPPPG